MGNGPGGLKEYIELFRSEPLFQGGLVWEWNNHGLLKKEGDLEYYAYGGDFGDEPNDADFVMDGLTLSDHTPMPSLLEYAKIIQPVSVVLTEDTKHMVVTNHYDFVDLGGLDASWHIVQDGETTEAQVLELPRIPAGENRTVNLPFDKTTLSKEAWLTAEFRLKEDTAWAEKGHIVAWDQLHLTGTLAKRSSTPAVTRDGTGLEVQQDRTKLRVKNGKSTLGFDLLQGNVTWEVDGVNLFQRGPELYFYRAMTQNDESSDGNMAEWDEAKVPMMHTQVRDVTWKTSDDNKFITHFKVRVAPKVLEWGVEANLIYTITADEPSLHVQASGGFVGKNKPSVIPRIGLLTIMPQEFNEVSWFGRGPGENYKDSKQACRIGQYEATVPELFTHYDYPQENGNREDLRWLQVSNSAVTLDVRRVGENVTSPFSFTAGRYMPFDLDDAKHPYDLKPLDMTILNLDYDNHGLGSASVGPRPFEKYRCKTEPFDFAFELSIV